MLHGRLSVSSAWMTAIISIRLLVVSASPPDSSLRWPRYIITLPQPPGPGFPLQALLPFPGLGELYVNPLGAVPLFGQCDLLGHSRWQFRLPAMAPSLSGLELMVQGLVIAPRGGGLSDALKIKVK